MKTGSAALLFVAITLLLLIGAPDLCEAAQKTRIPSGCLVQAAKTRKGYALILTFAAKKTSSQYIIGSASIERKRSFTGSYRGVINYDTGNNFNKVRGRFRLRGKRIKTPIGTFRMKRRLRENPTPNVQEILANGVLRVVVPD